MIYYGETVMLTLTLLRAPTRVVAADLATNAILLSGTCCVTDLRS